MSKPFRIVLIAKGILIAAIISLLLTIILGALYYFTSLSESVIYTICCNAIGILISSIYTSYKAGSKGLIYGISIGGGFVILTIIVYLIFSSFTPSITILAEKVLVSLVSGGIGGSIGALIKS